MALHTSDAIILRHRDYSESDRIVTFFTLEMGKISGIAKGVRRSSRRFSGKLDLFSIVKLEFKTGRDLFWLESAVLLETFPSIRLSFEHIAWASYLSERIEQLFGEQEALDGVFFWLKEVLYYLEKNKKLEPGSIRMAELKLLWLAGIFPQMEYCFACKAHVEKDNLYIFWPEQGGVACRKCSGASGVWDNHNELLINGEWLQIWSSVSNMPMARLWQIPFSDKMRISINAIITMFLNSQIGKESQTLRFLHQFGG